MNYTIVDSVVNLKNKNIEDAAPYILLALHNNNSKKFIENQQLKEELKKKDKIIIDQKIEIMGKDIEILSRRSQCWGLEEQIRDLQIGYSNLQNIIINNEYHYKVQLQIINSLQLQIIELQQLNTNK